MFEDFLPLVSKPGRYINNEVNAIHKDLAGIKTRVCLFFSDTYEVGMSHLGLRILYDILNSRPDTACERVFSPWTDYEKLLRASGKPLASLESNTPLARFDIIGITLQYELSYSNILTGLDLAHIPLHARDRSENDPVIIAGGPCAGNPEPLSDFIDVFFIGEAEESLHEIVDLRQQHKSRAGFLEALAQHEGFFVPSLGKKIVRRRFINNLEAAPYPDRPVLPLLKPIHDRVAVEVARGCIRGCRFCQAGIIYRPYRERSRETIKRLLAESLRCTGYEEISLASLSAGDYSEVQPLMLELLDAYREDRVSISLPSLRIGTLTPEMIRAVAGVRKTGFTLAPEAGTERLRRVINKPVSDSDLLNAASEIFANGWSVLKLYFMVGLPTETDADLDGIIKLAHEILQAGKKVSKRHAQINITVSTFVPKPHTPFQWFGQTPLEEIGRKQAYLEKGLRRRGINLKLHDPMTSLLEGAFARGDSRIGRVIEEAVRLGCRFDGWSECFDFRKWQEAFMKFGLDPAHYACRTFPLDDMLPWDHIRSGVTKEFLKREYQRSQAAEITENCRVACDHCGIGCRDGGTPLLGKPAASTEASEHLLHPLLSGHRQDAGTSETTARIRMHLARTGRIRFLSHLDFMTVVHRAVIRAGIPIAFSRGFNPHPKIAFGPALPVGMESEAEYLDMEIGFFTDLLQITKNLNSSLPQGVRILAAKVIPKKAISISGSISRYAYEVTVPQQYAEGIEKRVADFLSSSSLMIVSKSGEQKDIRTGIASIGAGSDRGTLRLFITLDDKDRIRPRIQDVIERLFSAGPESLPFFKIKRTGLYYRDGGQWKSPLDVS
jgi:radical SAM family uncharacterized protein/radical SAM-linked protein